MSVPAFDHNRRWNAALASFQRRCALFLFQHSTIAHEILAGARDEVDPGVPGGFSRSFLNDCLIAASAQEHGFILVTRNTADFTLISQVERGIRYQPPWPES